MKNKIYLNRKKIYKIIRKNFEKIILLLIIIFTFNFLKNFFKEIPYLNLILLNPMLLPLIISIYSILFFGIKLRNIISLAMILLLIDMFVSVFMSNVMYTENIGDAVYGIAVIAFIKFLLNLETKN